jgi:hypothetical protein
MLQPPPTAVTRHSAPHAGSARQQPQRTDEPSKSLLPPSRPEGTAIADCGPVGGAAGGSRAVSEQAIDRPETSSSRSWCSGKRSATPRRLSNRSWLRSYLHKLV